MTPECIEQKLKAHPELFPDNSTPTREQFETWPEQAAFVCSGDLDGLEKWRAEHPPIDRLDVLESPGGRSKHSGRLRHVIVVCSLILALDVAWYLIDRYCQIEVTFHAPDQKLSIEELFEFDKSNLTVPRQEILKKKLDQVWTNYDEISVKRVSAFTDPIGAPARNEELSRSRRATVIGVIEEYLRDPKSPKIKFSEAPTQAEPLGPPREALDLKLFNQCIGEYKDLMSSQHTLRVGTFPTAQNGAYPYPSAKYDPMGRFSGPRDSQKDSFWLIVNCLAPMRRVEIVWSGTVKVVPSAGDNSGNEYINLKSGAKK